MKILEGKSPGYSQNWEKGFITYNRVYDTQQLRMTEDRYVQIERWLAMKMFMKTKQTFEIRQEMREFHS